MPDCSQRLDFLVHKRKSVQLKEVRIHAQKIMQNGDMFNYVFCAFPKDDRINWSGFDIYATPHCHVEGMMRLL